MRGQFERAYSSRPRVVKLPSSNEEGYQILHRARDSVDGPRGGAWEYDLFTHNCEHFVNECWNPVLPPASEQIANAAASLGGGTAIGGIGGGAVTTVVAATIQPIATSVSSTYYALGFIPWGTTTSTVMTGLPLGAVIGISAAGVVGFGALGCAAGYGIRQAVLADTAANAEMLPIAIYNTSNRQVKASLSDGGAGVWDAVYRFCSGIIGIGSMSCIVGAKMTEELNPPTFYEGQEQYVLTIQKVESARQVQRRVSRGDVIKFDGRTCTIQGPAPPEHCAICYVGLPNVLLRPCGHWQYCQDCAEDLMQRNRPCPECRQQINRVDV